jgi:hypothetical protein
MKVGALVLLVQALASQEGNALIARARAVEAAQLEALAGTNVELHTRGVVKNGRTTHTVETFRRIQYRKDRAPANVFVRGQLDGHAVTEAELRKGTGAPERPKNSPEPLTLALAPLTSPDFEVTAVDSNTLRCRPRHDSQVAAITLLVDRQTGRKRSAVLEPAGTLTRLADRIEVVLTYAEDGAPAELRSSIVVKFAWILRSAELRSERVP